MRSLKKLMIRGAVGAMLAVVGLQAWAFKCDVDNNGRIDRVDIMLITAGGTCAHAGDRA